MTFNANSSGALARYKTINMSIQDAQELILLSSKQIGMQYPKDYEKLRDLCYEIHQYLTTRKLTNTAYYEELNIKIKNYAVSHIDDASLKQDLFIHMGGLLELHSDIISIKFFGKPNLV